MKNFTLIFFLIAGVASISTAQIRATTEDGKRVLLHNNGTWQYESQTQEVSTPVTETIIAPTLIVDASKEATSDAEEILFFPSPRLVRYFGENGGKIRCKLSSSNHLGSVTIQFNWEFPVVDSDRYFGNFGDGTEVLFTMSNDQKVKLVITGKSDIKRLESRNYSVISNSTYPLNDEQLAILTAYPIRKMEVFWKKKSEEYPLENTRVLLEQLPKVF